MKKLQLLPLLPLLIVILSLSSCQMIGDIFKAGVWAGVLLVVAVIALIIFILRRLF